MNHSKKVQKVIFAAIITLPIAIISCSPSAEEKDFATHETYKEQSAIATADSVSNLLSSGAVISATADSSHVFMRTADIKFSVKDVRKSTLEIEHVIRKYNGFITHTQLSGNKIKDYFIRTTEDSVTNVYKTNMWNEITLRVPNQYLDSALIEMDKQVDFLDTRTINADDVRLKQLALTLGQKRSIKQAKVVGQHINKFGKKLPETISGLELIENKQMTSDEKQLELLELNDKVSYSTVRMYIYQPEKTTYEAELIPTQFQPYTPSFGTKVKEAGAISLNILEGIVLVLSVIWPIILTVLIIWLFIKWLVKTKVLSRIFSL